ncbi:MAG: hypothetical protein CME20_05355 [Gemmatimonadetes bacterium]|jgi:rubredoxin|nr:hypothetical protein [Gemmatimonadota bacterium]|tara:strand:+ start:969 stop:1217 length:249 start_codon:yes stop_codon:yes gene_type:complete
MFYTLFAVLVLAVVALKYLRPFGVRCPQCQALREDPEYPLCPACGWIYDGSDDEGEDDIAAAEAAEAALLESGPEEEEDLRF